METMTPHRNAAQHLERAEQLIAECERLRQPESFADNADLAKLHIGAAECLAHLQTAEAHVTLVDVVTAYSLDAGDGEDKDHGPESWPPLQS